MTTILAVDLGVTMGCATCTSDVQIVSGTQSFKPGRYEGGGMHFQRLRCWPCELQACADPTGDRLIGGEATLDHSILRRKARWAA